MDKKDVFEGKVILARDIGKFNVAYNQIIKAEIGGGGDTEHEYAFGISYLVHYAVRLGIESKGNYSEGTYTVGPTISWVGGRLWATVGAVFGLNDKTTDRQRLLLGIPF